MSALAKWGRDFWASVFRHVGTAGLTWLSLGVKEGRVQWRDLWVALLVGSVLPSVFTFLQQTPLPDEEPASDPQKPPGSPGQPIPVNWPPPYPTTQPASPSAMQQAGYPPAPNPVPLDAPPSLRTDDPRRQALNLPMNKPQ